MRSNKILLRIFLFFILAFSFVSSVNAQRETKPQWGYGAAVIYNFATAGFGADVRIKIPLYSPNLFVVPEISYYPGFNAYHELYGGAALHYELFNIRKFTFYLLAGAYYNYWINADDFLPGQKKNNFTPEAGGGLVYSYGCIRPFIENRYDFKWKEDNLRIGIYFYPGACGGRRKEKCPKVNI